MKKTVLIPTILLLCTALAWAEEKSDAMKGATKAATSDTSAMASETYSSPLIQQTHQDIRKTLGLVPTFMRRFSETALPGAWEEMKGLQLNPHTAIPAKYKELVGIAVAAQIPCNYCTYFHTEAAKLNGATDNEIREAVAVAAQSRHWSTIMSGFETNDAIFKKDTDRMMRFMKIKMSKASAQMSQTMEQPIEKAGMAPLMTPQAVYRDVERTFGFVPQFIRKLPKDGLVGAWNEYRSLDMNPDTAIPAKYKHLITVAVAAQTPCKNCLYFHQKCATMHGATQQEINESVQLASLTRHWSAALNGLQIDELAFRDETNQIMVFLRKEMEKPKQLGGEVPIEELQSE